MKIIIDKYTGKILYATLIEVELQENEIIIDGLSGDFTHYDFKTKEFYNI
jgi:hypothetical protein